MSTTNDKALTLLIAQQTSINTAILSAFVEVVKMTRELGNAELIAAIEKVVALTEKQLSVVQYLDDEKYFNLNSASSETLDDFMKAE